MIKKILLALILLITTFLFIRFFLGGNEDDWICVDNRWVKHGNPKAPIPTGVCGENSQDKKIIGGDKDEYGCYITAGYSWCEEKQKCLRPWEEECPSKEHNLDPRP